MIQPEPTEPPPREAAGDRHVDAQQHCGPYRLDFYATADAVVCIVTDDELMAS